MAGRSCALVAVWLAIALWGPLISAAILRAQEPLGGPTPVRGGSYRIGIGDRLDISVAGRPQLTREGLTLDEFGAIRMPYVKQPIVALCATERELGERIERAYTDYLIEPQVSVSIRQYGSQSVELVGAVERPGLFQLQREVRLRELLTLAGGVKPNAAMFATFVHDESVPLCEKSEDGSTVPQFEHETQVTSVELAKLLRGEGGNPVIRPGDFIHVPEADQIFVVGHVVRPGPLPLNQRLTISRAIAMAGGRKPDAMWTAVLIRPAADGSTNATQKVDLREIERKGAPDMELQKGDVVDVQASVGKMALRVALSAAMSAAFYYPMLIIR
jgi:polysaccharide export outer membrane protein